MRATAVQTRIGLFIVSLTLCASAWPIANAYDAAQPLPPDELFGPLFADVQLAEIFEDQKTFADAVPKRSPAAIVRE